VPIKPENAARYPKDWPQIRARILARARNQCENCGVLNYELGGRVDGAWFPALPLGEKALRLEWPKPGTTAYCGILVGEIGGEKKYVGGPARIVRIVLTIAHLDHTPENCSEDNLRALCQRCHLRYDHEHHQRNARATRRNRKAAGELFA
jgi:5-methylcytosine-specific restriction endonuclease McrA